jgi:predicted phage tail protein
MLKKVGHALVVGGVAVYVAETVAKTDTYSKADANMQLVYKYGGAAVGAVLAGYLWHTVVGGV